jgi:predicted aspartyl protease
MLITATLMGFASAVAQATPPISVPMHEKGAATYYVQAQIEGYGDAEFMVDTGSGYVTINEETLAVLKDHGQARYVKQLDGVMADGAHHSVPVYELASLSIGAGCVLHNVEAAVFPGSTRQILGLSALKRAAPFAFSIDPPQLTLGGCSSAV